MITINLNYKPFRWLLKKYIESDLCQIPGKRRTLYLESLALEITEDNIDNINLFFYEGYKVYEFCQKYKTLEIDKEWDPLFQKAIDKEHWLSLLQFLYWGPKFTFSWQFEYVRFLDFEVLCDIEVDTIKEWTGIEDKYEYILTSIYQDKEYEF